MTAPDAPQVEPLALTLEEALEAVRMVEPHTYHLTLYGKQWKVEEDKRRAVREVVDRDESWPALLSRFFGHPVERRDDTAELVEAVEEYLTALDAWSAEPFPAHVEKHQERHAAAEASLRAALARVRGVS